MTSFAYAYLNDDSVSVYVTLPDQEQIIFYWNTLTCEQRRPPRYRVSRQTVEVAEITTYNDHGCVVSIGGRRAEFIWTEYANPDNDPAHKGQLVNFAEWEYDKDFHYQSPTSEYRQPTYSGYYGEPQPYEEEEENEQ